jgi:Ca2+-transporting ATPase
VHGDWFEGAMAGITLAISLLPEEFPMVLAIFLALGAYRLARRNVLVRRSSVTETLGAATLLCVDKTGTLTRNHMEVARLYAGGAIEPVPDAPDASQHRLLQAALRASSEHPVDPMDRAVHDLAARLEIPAGGIVLESFPIRPELLAFIQTWRFAGETIKAAKGAPEAVLRLAGADGAEHARIAAAVEEMAREGLRVLAVAEKRGEAPFVVLGLVGFEDPIRDDVPQAVAAARRAGVSVAMITGDYPATALAIARAAGIDATHGAKTGAELLSSKNLAGDIRDVRVFARVTPTTKLALVEAFKADGHIVVMTGDGVNDGPALAAAHIGVAMGLRGSDVAREAAHIVLLDDSFPSIVAGIELGRRISNNLRKALTFVTAIHIPIAGLALAPILMGLPPMLLPAHVVLMELIIDPTCSLAFEAEPGEKDAMLKPPRPQSEPLFGTRDIVFGSLQGLVVFLAVLSVYVLATGFSVPEAEARGLSFATLIVANLSLALSDALPRGVSPFARENMAFWAIAAIALSVVAAGLYFPPLAGLLRFAPPQVEDLAVASLLAMCAGGWWGILRRLVS